MAGQTQAVQKDSDTIAAGIAHLEEQIQYLLEAKSGSVVSAIPPVRFESKGLQYQADTLISLEASLDKAVQGVRSGTGIVDGDVVLAALEEGRRKKESQPAKQGVRRQWRLAPRMVAGETVATDMVDTVDMAVVRRTPLRKRVAQSVEAPLVKRWRLAETAANGASGVLGVERLATGSQSAQAKDPPISSVENGKEGMFLCKSSDDFVSDIISDVPVHAIKGSLNKNVAAWMMVCKSGYVLDMVKNGFSISFKIWPDQKFSENNKSALQEKVFVESKIREFLAEGFVEEVEERPWVVNPLTVKVFSGKKRFILDLQYVNQHINPPKFKLDDLKVALSYVRKGGYIATFDVNSGYFHLDANKNYQKFLGFSWVMDDKRRFFVFTVLPFGLSTGPFMFTKLLRPLVQRWRSHGIKSLIYIDDGFITGASLEYTRNQAEFCKHDLKRLGFHLNDKCVWEPTQEVKFLGFLINLEDFSVSIPIEKVSDLQTLLSKLTKSSKASARMLSKVTGKLISMGVVLGSITRLKTRHMYKFIAGQMSWDFLSFIGEEVRNELLFWQRYLKTCSKAKLLSYQMPTVLSWTVASATAAGAHVSINGISSFDVLNFSSSEMVESSTWRELRAIEFGLQSFTSILRGKIVKLYTDNQAAVSIVRSGSRKCHLQSIAETITDTCLKLNIRLEIEWIPREQNQLADYFSKSIDYDDWKVNSWVFSVLSDSWGPFDVDRFASQANTQLRRFNSKVWYPKTETVDAFSCHWGLENNWLVPPVSLVSRALKHLMLSKGKRCLVVPYWRSAEFWPQIVEFRKLGGIQDSCLFSPRYRLIDPAFERGCFSENMESPLVAFRLDFSTLC